MTFHRSRTQVFWVLEHWRKSGDTLSPGPDLQFNVLHILLRCHWFMNFLWNKFTKLGSTDLPITRREYLRRGNMPLTKITSWKLALVRIGSPFQSFPGDGKKRWNPLVGRDYKTRRNIGIQNLTTGLKMGG